MLKFGTLLILMWVVIDGFVNLLKPKSKQQKAAWKDYFKTQNSFKFDNFE